jgi:hypothetical protein
MNLNDLVVVLLHQIAGPRRHRHGRRGGRHHHYQAPAPPPSASSPSNPRVLERPLSPSPDRLSYWSMESSNHDVSPRDRHGRPFVVHGWGRWPNPVASMVGPSSGGHEGEEEGEEDEDELRPISVVPGLL